MMFWKIVNNLYIQSRMTMVNHFFNKNRVNSAAIQKNILIYADIGTVNSSVIGFSYRLSKMIDHDKYAIKLVDGDFIQHADWIDNAALLVMPGGRARPYYSSLGADIDYVKSGKKTLMHRINAMGKGNEKIKQFVESKKGAYLGVCAGAYYASKLTVFERGNPLEIIDKGVICFFNGEAEGPVFKKGKFSYLTLSGFYPAKVEFNIQDKPPRDGYVYFNGGCFFKNPEKQDGFKVLARYTENHLPAVIAKGNVVLSGVHFESSHHFIFWKKLFDKKQYTQLKNDTPFQYGGLDIILDALNIQRKKDKEVDSSTRSSINKT